MTRRLRTAERYSTILEVNRVAITEPALEEVFQGTCGAVKNIVPFDRMGLSLYAPETASLKLVAAAGCGPDSFYQPGLKLDCSQTHHGWVFQHKKAIVRQDLQREVEFQTEQYNLKEGIRSYCAVPLVMRGESLGVIIILSSRKNQYSKEHAEFLQEVSNQLVLAVKSLMPFCVKHLHTKLICPRCIASGGGRTTAAKHKTRLSEWGKQGGRGRKKPAGGLTAPFLG